MPGTKSPSPLAAFPRELLTNLTLRDLRGQYKRSALGWAWSAINPLAVLVVYSIVFATFLRIEPTVGDPSGLDSYAFFLIVALLPWQFHAVSLTRSATSLVSNHALISKVYFPRAVLPASIVASSFVTLLIEMGVLSVVMMGFTDNFVLPWLPVVVGIMILQAGFSLGLGLLVSALNVYFRDIEHFLNIAIQPWFFLTPIIYPLTAVPADRELFGISYRTLYQLNPMVTFVQSYRNVLYDMRFPSFERWAAMLVFASLAIAVGYWVFRRLEPRLAEEI